MELFVPGRLCLFGEHSDWAGYYNRTNSEIKHGAAIVSGIEQGIYAHVERDEKFRFRTILENGTRTDWIEYDLSEKTLKEEAKKGGFFSYVTGVAAYMLEYYDVGGISVDCYKVTIPIKKGLSSSAAICVLIARAFSMAYDLQISVRGEMEAAYRGEILTPSRCGRLDQACAYGTKPVLMEFNGESLDVERLAVGKDLYWVFCDLAGKKDTKKILASLNACYPYAQNEIERNVQKALGEENLRVVGEAVGALKDGNAKRIGELMTEAQDIFDHMVAPACPSELESPLLHRLLNDPIVKELSLGAKGVGSQGDGTAQMICENAEQQKKLIHYLSKDMGLAAFPFCIRAQHSVRKAVIPLAGFGTRLFPATKVVDKAFFPIIDYDGIIKPALMVILEELVTAGIEEIALIIQPGQKKEFEKLFEKDMTIQNYRKLPKDRREYNVTIQHIAQKITYIFQTEQLGFGHAVYQAKDFAGNDVVLMVLGDHLYHSDSGESCTAQMINAYEQSGMLTVSLDEVALEQVNHYGILQGNFIDEEQRMMQVGAMVEKPTSDYAKQFLGVKDNHGRDRYYCVFGQYVLTPDVFRLLRQKVEHFDGRGEIGLTEVLDEIRKDSGMSAYRINGKRFDIGIPEEYRKTLQNFGRQL